MLQDHSLTYGPHPAGSMTSLSFASRPGFETAESTSHVTGNASGINPGSLIACASLVAWCRRRGSYA